ncbi:MAG: N-acetylmuramoyl-L-alanine amidase [Ardenticatenia bacterium]|nr:N-acetylmuramoyl-L-alanine amidase [Ardenticatenia bacterium]
MPPDIEEAIWRPSPNKNPRGRFKVDTVVLHATGGGLEPSLNWLTNPNSKVSAHYVIAKDGTLYQLVEESMMAWHAGKSRMPPPDNRENVNWFSVGIELENANTGRDPYPEPQLATLIRLLRHLVTRYNVPRRNIVTHRDVALPKGRKSDPLGLDVQAVLDRVYRTVEGVPPQVGTLVVNRPLVGLHARNDRTFTETDYRIIAEARVEALKTLSFTEVEVYRRCRQINPNMEFIVRLYKHMPRNANPPRPEDGPVSPQAFADEFRDTINRLYETLGIVKFEIHNEPNHLTGLEGWGQEEPFAREFARWYRRVFALLKERHPFALFGFPGLAVPHKDLEWLEWCREAIEMSDWLGCHIYWQTPPQAPETYKSDTWGLRFKHYHAKFPHKLIEITEYGNSNGQSGLPLPPQEQARQYVWWLNHIQQYPYLGSAHAFIATSPDPQWVNDLFTWGDDRTGRLFPVVQAVGQQVRRPPVPPEWGVVWKGFQPPETITVGTSVTVSGTMTNAGRRPWRQTGPTRVILIQRWLTPDSRRVGDPLYLLLPHDVRPSEEARLSLRLTPPAKPGEYRLRYDMYDVGGRRYLTAAGALPLVYTVQIRPREPERPVLRAEWGDVEVPDRVEAGQRVSMTVTVQNTGRAVWRAGGEPLKGVVRLGYHWIAADGREVEGRTRGVLPRDVAPGERVTLRGVEVVAPQTPGTYTLRLDMVSELVAWFRQVGSKPLVVDVEVVPARPALAFEWVEVNVPTRMRAGETVTGRVTVRNVGREPWVARRPDGRGVVRLGYHWRTPDGQPVDGWADVRTPLPRDVLPGQQVTLDSVQVAAPPQPGQYRLELNLVKEGVTWFDAPLDGAGRLMVTVEAPAPAEAPEAQYRVEYRAHTVPSQMRAGQAYEVTITLRNTGTRPWRSRWPSPVHVAHHWIASDGHVAGWWDAFRTALPEDVAPGETVRVEGIVLRAPEQGGDYVVRWDLVEEGQAWFSDQGSPALEVPVTVMAPPEWAVAWVDHETPSTLTAGLEVRVGLRARNTGTKGWPKGGRRPVRVSYRWYDAEGQEIEDVEQVRTALPHAVKAGDEVRLMAALAVPSTPGDYRLVWDLIREGVGWFQEFGSPPLEVDVRVRITPSRGRGSVQCQPQCRKQVTLAVDGNPDTFWDSLEVQVPGMFFEIDLGQERTLDGVIFRSPGRGYPVGYRILISRDGETWVTVAERPQNWRDAAAAFDARPVRFVRIEQTGTPGYRATWRIGEVELSEAPPWQATASHNAEEAALAVDRDPDTVWSSQARQAPGMWFEVDMGKERVIEGVEVRSPGRGFAVGYRLLISADREQWVVVAERDRNWQDINVLFTSCGRAFYSR